MYQVHRKHYALLISMRMTHFKDEAESCYCVGLKGGRTLNSHQKYATLVYCHVYQYFLYCKKYMVFINSAVDDNALNEK